MTRKPNSYPYPFERLLPGEEDVAFYEEHGYCVTPKVLPDDVIDAAIRGAERHWAGERDWRLPVSSASGTGSLGKNRYRTFLNERGEPWHITNDDLCRKDASGHPDYSDPAAFPVLWSADGAR